MAGTPVLVRQVTGTDLIFIACVAQGELPQPELMEFSSWQVWRSGNWPAARTDSLAIPSRQEVGLRKTVMHHFCEDDRNDQLTLRGAVDADKDGALQDDVTAHGAGASSDDPPGLAGGTEASATAQGSDARLQDPLRPAGVIATASPRPAALPMATGIITPALARVDPGSGEGGTVLSSPGSEGRKSPESWHQSRQPSFFDIMNIQIAGCVKRSPLWHSRNICARKQQRLQRSVSTWEKACWRCF